MTMRGKQISARAIEIEKENCSKNTVKYKAMFGFFSKIEALFSLKKCMVTQIFVLDTKSTC